MVKECRFEGCDRPYLAKGLCRPHYKQQWAGKELTPVRELFTNPSPTTKICTKCLRVKSFDEFYKVPGTQRPRSHCKECMIQDVHKAYVAKKGQNDAEQGLGAPQELIAGNESTTINERELERSNG